MQGPLRRRWSLADLLAAEEPAREPVALPATEARVAAVEGAGGRAALLALQDASVNAPLGMYLHSRWLGPLSRGSRPVLTGATHARNPLCPTRSAAV